MASELDVAGYFWEGGVAASNNRAQQAANEAAAKAGYKPQPTDMELWAMGALSVPEVQVPGAQSALDILNSGAVAIAQAERKTRAAQAASNHAPTVEGAWWAGGLQEQLTTPPGLGEQLTNAAQKAATDLVAATAMSVINAPAQVWNQRQQRLANEAEQKAKQKALARAEEEAIAQAKAEANVADYATQREVERQQEAARAQLYFQQTGGGNYYQDKAAAEAARAQATAVEPEDVSGQSRRSSMGERVRQAANSARSAWNQAQETYKDIKPVIDAAMGRTTTHSSPRSSGTEIIDGEVIR